MGIINLLTAFGLGSIVTVIIQSWLNKRSEYSKRQFQEKKEAYIGLLESFYRAGVEETEEAAQAFGHWQMRCELVAPKAVRDAIQAILDTNEDRNGASRTQALKVMKEEMRLDLGIEK